mgnify:CR=1 FL=1|tara:strand:- start:656 stop:1177 length:522 start_codon:yes stop_codon:yes gene_type:complete
MKSLLLPLLAALALPTAVEANIDPKIHKICKDARDYMGCVQANKNKKISIFEDLSKKEIEFLKAYIKSPKRVSTSNGKWILQGINERSGDETYIDINSIKKVGRLVSIKRCLLKGSSNKKLCDNPTNNFPGGTSIRLFNCEKRLHFKSFRPPEWDLIDKSEFNLATAKLACKY